ncbi:MAG: peptidase [Alphaproteobacteria bacterium]|nr:peptidase [Alphaproteobacteria bacterium]
MTYCIGLKIAEGLVFLSDTRTNAGVDHIARYRKMFTWEVEGERAVALMTAGNLSMGQGVVTRINRAIQVSKQTGEETILNADSMFRVAEIVGETLQALQARHRDELEAQGAVADASIILGGQRRGGRPRLFQVYSAGNFIEATEDTPYFQIGEAKYGKPILDRVITVHTAMKDALKAAFVSMDSTLRSNISVGMPLDFAVLRGDTLKFSVRKRIEPEDANFTEISHGWSDALREAFLHLPEVKVD